MANHQHTSPAAQQRGGGPIQALVLQVMLVVSVLAAISLAGAYVHQRDRVGEAMGRREAQQTAAMVYEHLYSVMRKGWTRAEMDEIIHKLSNRLPNYEVEVVRGVPVAQQFGDLPGDAAKRLTDPLVEKVLETRNDVFVGNAKAQRYGFAVKMQDECRKCHTQSKVGDVNGVIVVSIPTHYLHEPLEEAIQPLAILIAVGVLLLTFAIFVAIRVRVVAPVQEFSRIVAERDEAIRTGEVSGKAIAPGPKWPTEVVHLAQSFNALMERVERDQRQLAHHSQHDSLTGLANRRRFDDFLSRCIAEANVGRGTQRFGLLLLDLDGFKPVNDTHGHAAGDAVLAAVAKALMATMRPSDLVARIGGDEFAVVAVDTTEPELRDLKDRIQDAVGRVQVRFGHSMLGAACSIGVASYGPQTQSAAALLESADAGMYADKECRKAGR